MDEKTFHREFKPDVVRRNRQALKDHGMGDNPDLLLGPNNQMFLRDVKTGTTIPIGL